jgi:hypothetical protein
MRIFESAASSGISTEAAARRIADDRLLAGATDGGPQP